MIGVTRAGFAAAAGAAFLAGCGGDGSAPLGEVGDGAALAQQAEWNVLFDGSSLEGWEQVGDANWRVESGVVRADAGNGHLVSAAPYGDFELHVEFWVSDDANSGIFLRCGTREEITPQACYEINIFDQRPDPTYRTGSIVEIAAPQAHVSTGGRWNTYEIRARGSRLTVVLNGMTTVDVEDASHREGPFTLQYGAGTVMFRSVRVRAL